MVSRETSERLAAYEAVLRAWNPKINLISAADLPDLRPRHIDDALALVPLIPVGTDRAIDLGSGGGLPGLVLAIATGIAFHLVESDTRKAAFLREAARATAAPVTVHHARIEAVLLDPAPLVTARALAPLPRLLELSARFLAPGGLALFPKGDRLEEELTQARRTWTMGTEIHQGPNGPLLSVSDPCPIPA
ncbi:MAG: 16S rRNA (guanine(527)-N(7))-methyltransferase RsmG [Rhodospirillales bacterium]|nr:16S rRNA (guanine(527)-N(7))-methyltransferase RsmG [Rhodospirillales bacterium]